ncbi:hypothetical protein G6F23_012608 [Rhizopus arrhizus]|nr:hypothetical protein G6F23_012608 [Rhizopus arrhizus]
MAGRMQPKRLLELDASHASLASQPKEGSTLLRLRPPGRVPIPSSRRQRIPPDRGGPVVLYVPVIRLPSSLPRRRLLPQALAQSLLIAALASSGIAAAQSTDDGDKATQTPASQTLQTVQGIANQLGTITEGSGAYTPGTIATATRLVLTPRQTPQTISVITRAEMDDFGLHGIDDVMRVTPGISIVTYDSERTEYYARGFAVQNFQYDGIPMSRDSAYSAGNTLSDTAIYDRIEVLKGATGLSRAGSSLAAPRWVSAAGTTTVPSSMSVAR